MAEIYMLGGAAVLIAAACIVACFLDGRDGID